MTKSAFLFIVLTIIGTVAGQLLVKHGMSQLGKAPTGFWDLGRFLARSLVQPYNFLGLTCAFAAALSWMTAVSQCPLSIAYPFMILSVVLVLALTPVVFGETVFLRQWVGVGIVFLGLWIATRSA